MKVGKTSLCWMTCTVKLIEGNNGWFEFSKNGIINMGVGADCPLWNMESTLAHELFEAVCANLQLRFYPRDRRETTLDDIEFHMDHQEFSDVCSYVGPAFAEILPMMLKAKKKWDKR